jgi:hypothetical protein
MLLHTLICFLLLICSSPSNNERTETNTQPMESQKELTVGDRIELFGGYDYEPRYLQNPKADSKAGTVLKFIDSERGDKSAVVELDEQIVGDSITTKIIVINARYEKQDWSTNGPVHLELHKQVPDFHFNMQDPKGEWIEAAASYKIL